MGTSSTAERIVWVIVGMGHCEIGRGRYTGPATAEAMRRWADERQIKLKGGWVRYLVEMRETFEATVEEAAAALALEEESEQLDPGFVAELEARREALSRSKGGA